MRGRVGGPVDELPTRSATSAREKGSPARSGFFARRRVEPVRRDGSGRAARPPERAAKARTSRRDGAGRAGLLALAATVGHDRGVQVLHERGVHRVSVRCSSGGLTGPTLGPRAKARPNPPQTAAKTRAPWAPGPHRYPNPCATRYVAPTVMSATSGSGGRSRRVGPDLTDWRREPRWGNLGATSARQRCAAPGTVSTRPSFGPSRVWVCGYIDPLGRTWPRPR